VTSCPPQLCLAARRFGQLLFASLFRWMAEASDPRLIGVIRVRWGGVT
jgi:hypothetical protein